MKFEISSYTRLAVDFNFYVPPAKRLNFNIEPVFYTSNIKVEQTYKNNSNESESIRSGFSFRTGIGYQINNEFDMAVGFERSPRDHRDAKVGVKQISN